MHRAALLVTALATPVALADVTLAFEGTVAGRPQSITMQLKGKSLLLTTTGADGKGSVMLRDGAGKRFLVIDHASKSYSEMSDQDASSMKDQAAQVQAMMAARMANLPPEKRAQMEAMLGKMAAPQAAAPRPATTFTFAKKGTSRTVNGRACEEYVVTENDVAAGEGCFIAWKDAGISREALRAQFREATEGLPTEAQSMDASLGAERAPGLPAWRRRVDAQGAVLSETTLKRLSTDAIPDAVFAVPAGYTARTLSGPSRPPR